MIYGKYLSGSIPQPPVWNSEEQQLVDQIKKDTRPGREKTLYTGLRLLNCVSEQVFQHYGTEQKALIFYSGDKCQVINPFRSQHCYPDIVGAWTEPQTFPSINCEYHQSRLNQSERMPKDSTAKQLLEHIWCELATIGQVKVISHGEYPFASYLQNRLQLHPELNAVLGFTIQAEGYALFYHDSAVIHRLKFGWEPGPLYAFIQKLYTRPF